MNVISKEEGQLVVSAITLLSHLNEELPTEADISKLLNIPTEVIGLKVSALVDLGVIVRVESAFENHLEIIDFDKISLLESEALQSSMDEDLANFEKKKQAESEKMEQLFESADHERRREERIKKMDEDFFNIDKKKTDNPFGDD